MAKPNDIKVHDLSLCIDHDVVLKGDTVSCCYCCLNGGRLLYVVIIKLVFFELV